MAIVKPHQGDTENRPEAPIQEDTFTHVMGDGSTIVCGKPQGVLKLRLRDILPKDALEDSELVTLASACLSIRTVNGAPLWLKTYNHFEAFLNRFGSDENVDEFTNKYQRLVNPQIMDAVEKALDEAEAQNVKPSEIKDFVAERVMKAQREQKERVKN